MRIEQPSFNFEDDSIDNDPSHIEKAVVRDDSEGGVSDQELIENDDGTFRNEAGDIFEKTFEEGAVVYHLRTRTFSPETQELIDEIGKQNPDMPKESVEALARDRMNVRRRKQAQAAIQALKRKRA